MMLHRHFEKEKNPNVTTLADFQPVEKRDEPILTEEPVEAQKKRGRKPKAGE